MDKNIFLQLPYPMERNKYMAAARLMKINPPPIFNSLSELPDLITGQVVFVDERPESGKRGFYCFDGSQLIMI